MSGPAAPLVEQRHAAQRRARLVGIAEGALSNFANRATGAAISFIAVPITIAYLGPERYGAWVAIFSLMAWLYLTDFGLANALANQFTRQAGARDIPALRRHIANGFLLLSLVGLLGSLAAWLIVPLIPWPALLGLASPRASAEIAPAITAALVCLFIQLPLGLQAKLYMALGDGKIGNGWAAAGNIAGLAALLGVTCTDGGLVWLVIGFSGAGLLVNVIGLVWLFTRHRPDLRPRLADFAPTALPATLRDGGKFFLIQLLALLVFETDNLIIGHYLGAARVPEYSLAYSLFAYTSLPQNLAFNYLWTAYTEAIARRDIAWVRATFRASFLAGLGFTAVTTVALIFIAPPFIHWWTNGAVTAGAPLILWLAAWSLMHALTNPHACLLAAASRLKAQIIYSSLAVAVNIPLSIYLVTRIGIQGAIAGTVISYALCILVPIRRDTARLLRELGP